MTTVPPDLTVLTDVAYLPGDRAEKLDVWLPPASFARPLPAILLIHGGGWRIGDKADPRERNIAGTFAEQGYAVFSINYLLNLGATDAAGQLTLSRIAWPQNLIDCKTALRFIRANAGLYGIDPPRIAAIGGSAGGHLSMLLGATVHHDGFNREGLYPEQANAVRCVLNFYGDYDIRGRRISPFEGSSAAETSAHETAASPVTHFDADTPPMFITHGTADTIIPVERSRLLARELEQRGLDYVYVEIAGAPHSYHLQPDALDLRPIVFSFLKKHLG